MSHCVQPRNVNYKVMATRTQASLWTKCFIYSSLLKTRICAIMSPFSSFRFKDAAIGSMTSKWGSLDLNSGSLVLQLSLLSSRLAGG
jgi:hypothetical protein